MSTVASSQQQNTSPGSCHPQKYLLSHHLQFSKHLVCRHPSSCPSLKFKLCSCRSGGARTILPWFRRQVNWIWFPVQWESFTAQLQKGSWAKRVSQFHTHQLLTKIHSNPATSYAFSSFQQKVGTGSCAFFESWKHSPLWTSPYHWWQSHVWKSPLVAGAFFE